MATPALKDLPKVDDSLKSQLEGFSADKLSHAETKEKNVLPSAEDVVEEKNKQNLFAGIESFDTAKLKHAETQEKNPLPDKDVVAAEKQHQNLLNGVEHFNKACMKHTETDEKNHLPPLEGLSTNFFCFMFCFYV
uniref:CSON010893 protein n=1 Tax=Culicoides sonorensis TaxID=179676 RepID=A0A336M6L2_CULSO